MKPVFIIAIVAAAMIGVMVPSVYAATYVNDDYPYEFSINYPTDWLIFEPDENEKKNNPGIMVYLNNNYDATSIVTIYYYEFEDWDTYSTNELIDSNLLRDKQYCESQSLSTTGIECTNYKNYEELTKVLKINGYPSITTVSYMENRYQIFGEQHSLIETITDIYIENAIYQIVSETDQSLFLDSGSDDVYQIVNSFTVGNPYVNSNYPTSVEEAAEIMIEFNRLLEESEKEKAQEIIIQQEIQIQESSKGGGCLIATATYGSEMSSEVQQLRELRDNTLLNTESGTQFMEYFNDVYYSFSPIIADYERENPVFRETVKLAITPLISSLSILNHVDMDSEESVLGYGISLIILNLGMYLGVPAVVIVGIRKRF